MPQANTADHTLRSGACPVEMHFEISPEPFCAGMGKKNARHFCASLRSEMHVSEKPCVLELTCEMPQTKTATLTLAREPVHSKCTWTFQKEHFTL